MYLYIQNDKFHTVVATFLNYTLGTLTFSYSIIFTHFQLNCFKLLNPPTLDYNTELLSFFCHFLLLIKKI